MNDEGLDTNEQNTNEQNTNDMERRDIDSLINIINLLVSEPIHNDTNDLDPLVQYNLSGAETGVRDVRGAMSEEFINNLDEFTVDTEFLKKETQCSICLEDFKEGDKCVRLPCEEPHVFHNESEGCSVLPWLRRNNTCPMCRHEFPTDPPPNEQIIGLTYEMIGPTLHPGPNALENTFTNIIGEYIRELNETVHMTEDADLQRAIELSLNDTL